MKDNTFGIKFGAFRIRDMQSGFVLVDVKETDLSSLDNISEEDDKPEKRLVKYHLGPDFLELRTIGLQVEFAVGSIPVPSLLMLERHYFKG